METAFCCIDIHEKRPANRRAAFFTAVSANG